MIWWETPPVIDGQSLSAHAAHNRRTWDEQSDG